MYDLVEGVSLGVGCEVFKPTQCFQLGLCLLRVAEGLSSQLLLQSLDCLPPYCQAPHHDG